MMRRGRNTWAVGVVAVAIVGCGGGSVAAPSTTVAAPTESRFATTMPSPPPSTAPVTAAPTTTAPPPTTATTVDPALVSAPGFTVPFTFRVPEGLVLVSSIGEPGYRAWTSGDNWLTFTTAGPSSIEEWVEVVESFGATVVAEGIGAVAGVDSPYREVGFERSALLFGDATEAGYIALAGETLRVYVSEAEGTAVSLVASSPNEDFPTWIERVEAILATVEWGA